MLYSFDSKFHKMLIVSILTAFLFISEMFSQSDFLENLNYLGHFSQIDISQVTFSQVNFSQTNISQTCFSYDCSYLNDFCSASIFNDTLYCSENDWNISFQQEESSNPVIVREGTLTNQVNNLIRLGKKKSVKSEEISRRVTLTLLLLLISFLLICSSYSMNFGFLISRDSQRFSIIRFIHSKDGCKPFEMNH